MAAAAPLIADPIVRNRGTLVGSLCHADPQGDWASVVTALGGHVIARGPSGQRSIPMTDLVSGPFQNVLAYDEIAIEAVIPAPKDEPAGGYLKLERRVGDFATAGVAVALERSGRVDHPCGHRAHRRRLRRRSTPPTPGSRSSARRSPPTASRRRQTWPRKRHDPAPITAAVRSSSATSCTRS